MNAKPADRRATEIGRQAEVSAIEVDDPWDGEKITVLRQLRDDPLARLHSHREIDEAQYRAGRAYQRDWELVEQGAQAIDPTKEKVDGGRGPETLPERRLQASDRLAAAKAQLGLSERKLVHAFLIQENYINRIAIETFGRDGKRWANYYGKMLRDALDLLATAYDFSSKGSKWEPPVDISDAKRG